MKAINATIRPNLAVGGGAEPNTDHPYTDISGIADGVGPAVSARRLPVDP